jgi:hypothetical protein
MEAVDKTSSALITPLTAYRMESKTLCGTSLLAAATRHIEYKRMGEGEGFAKNSSCDTTGKRGAISLK